MIRWQQVYGVEPRPLDEITEGGPAYDSDELQGLEVVSASGADTDCTVAHLGDEAVLVDPAGACAYTVPAGYIYRQPCGGSTWEAVALDEYRAAYAGDCVLTGPEHAGLSDADLLAEALSEAQEAGLIGPEPHRIQPGQIRIGTWREKGR